MNKFNFKILGMTCTTCSRLSERALKKCAGVTYASVNLASESAFVTADDGVTYDDLFAAVRKAGYEPVKDVPDNIDEIRFREAKQNLIAVYAAGMPVCILMYLKMFAGMNFAFYGVLEIASALFCIFYCGRKTVRGAWIALVHKHCNMDTLILLSSLSCLASALLHAVGFDIPSFGATGVMIIMLHLTGRYIESRLRDAAAREVKALLKLAPREARIITENGDVMVPVDAVKLDAIISVNAGERIPLDGIIEEGRSGVDESLLTGESIPVSKTAGDCVTSGSLNLSATLKIRVTKVGSDTFLSQMLELVREAQGSKIPIQATADRITLWFVPAVITIASASFIIHCFYGGRALYSFIATLVIACPCAIGLAIPIALVVSAGEATKNGLLIRNAEAIQTMGTINTVIFDKTGTITEGSPRVTKYSVPDASVVYALEKNSGHPLAHAITEKISSPEFERDPLEIEAEEIAGEGVRGTVGTDEWFIGRSLNPGIWGNDDNATIVEVRKNGNPVGFFAITDALREDSPQAISELHKMGIETVMATGDNEYAAAAAARAAGIDNVAANVKPDEKLDLVHKKQAQGRHVLMAGDGINDAAALKGAEVGVAMGSGMDLAVDSADVVIVHGGISKIVSAIRISAKTSRIIKQNLFCALVYNALAIPFAAAGFLHPAAAEAAMAASSITVILNSLRIKDR